MFDIAIVGAGPTGASAAIFAAKAGKKTILIDHEKTPIGRALLKNYPGIKEINGADLLKTIQEQAVSFGAEWVKDSVSDIRKESEGFVIETDNREPIQAKQVILATGMVAKLADKTGLKTKPGTEPFIKTIFEVDENGKTNIEGIWAAGICAGASFHTVIAAGDGARVAINVISELNGERYVDHDALPKK
jgi:thioredoxin reductase (NADPH)